MTPEQVRQIIREELGDLIKSDRLTVARLLQFLDGRNIQVGKTTGSKFGTEAAQKIAFHGIAPCIQASAISAPATQGVGYVQADVQSIVTAVNLIRTVLVNKGFTA